MNQNFAVLLNTYRTYAVTPITNQTLAINELNPEHVLPNSHYSMIVVVTASVGQSWQKNIYHLDSKEYIDMHFFGGERKDVFS